MPMIWILTLMKHLIVQILILSDSCSDSASESASSSSRDSYSTVSDDDIELVSIIIKAKKKNNKSDSKLVIYYLLLFHLGRRIILNRHAFSLKIQKKITMIIH